MFEYGLIIGDKTGVILDFGGIMFMIMLGLICAVIGYFLGGINSAILISKTVYHDDIRNYGSHNAGMTNMMRTYGKAAAVGTLAGDLLKTVVAILIARVIFGEAGAYIAGTASVIGHIYPCYFGFKGGKGVATVAMMVLMTNPLCFAILFTIFVLLVLGFKYISLGSVMCLMLYPLLSNRLGVMGFIPTICTFIVAILIVFKHKDNIKRLLNGTESKFSFKKSKKAGEKPDIEKDNSEK